MTSVAKSKIYEPDTIPELPLPEIMNYENIIDAPRSVAELNIEDGQKLESINSDGDFLNDVINPRINTATKNILSGFDFGTTNYAGGLKAGDIAWNTSTGAYVSGSGIVINRAGILGANGSVVTFSIDATTGDATFRGSIAASDITGSTITGGLIRTSTTGERIEIEDDALESFDTTGTRRTRIQNSGIAFYDEDGVSSGSIFGGNPDTMSLYAGGQLYNFDEDGFYPYGILGAVGSLGLSAASSHWATGYIDDLYTDELDVDAGLTLGGVRRTSWPSAGTTTLSGLTIDTNKNWGGYNITGAGDIEGEDFTADHLYLNSNGNIYYNGVVAFDFSTVSDDIWAGSAGFDSFSPYATAAMDLGNTSYRWAGIYADELDLSGGIDIGGDLDMNTYDIFAVGDLIFSTGEYINSNSASNDMRYYAGDQHEFYVGSTIQAIIDENIFTEGNLLANGSKPFLIPHPDGSARMLRYTAQESPEVILRHRGRAKTDSIGECEITLPNHFTLVTDADGEVTVNLTAIGDNIVFLKEQPTNSTIKVGSAGPIVEFHYEVMAIRNGYLNQAVELDTKDKELDPADLKLVNRIKGIGAKNIQAGLDQEARVLKLQRAIELKNAKQLKTDSEENETVI